MTDSTSPQRPSGVPAAATWHDPWQEWVLGEKRGEACVGEWTQWHGTQGHRTCVDVFDDEGNLLHVTRFHPDGTFSQKVPHRDGAPHGPAEYQRSEHPSEERSMEGLPAAVFRAILYWEDGEQPQPARFFDKEGQEIGAMGQPKPSGVHAQARSNEEGLWVLSQAALQQDYQGVETVWRPDGSLKFERHHDDDGNVTRYREYHPDGVQAIERDYATRTGWYRTGPAASDVAAPQMPGDAREVKFNIDVVNAQTGLFWPRDEAFFDADGNELSDTGLTIRKPHPDAYLVKEDTWSNPKVYWRHDEEVAGQRVTSTWRREGVLVFKTVYEHDQIRAHTCYDEAGEPQIEEAFFARMDGERPVNQTITVHHSTGRIVVSCDDEGRCTTFRRFEGDTCIETIDNETLDSVTVDTFEAEFSRRFEQILATSQGVVWFDFFDIQGVEIERVDEFFAAAAIAGDGAGGEILTVLEGKHAGSVYFNDHEEGLYALECVDEYIDEEELDTEEMTKDALIEAMPFMENKLADSLSAFLGGIRVNAHRTYWKNHGAFKRIEGAD